MHAIDLYSILHNLIVRSKKKIMMSIYNFSAKTQDGSEVSLADYKGNVLLIVNTATGCGFTPQYDELQDLVEAVL